MSLILIVLSDGAGQTGTFITSDYTIQKLKRERKVDIFELIKELRLQRISLVETKVILSGTLAHDECIVSN